MSEMETMPYANEEALVSRMMEAVQLAQGQAALEEKERLKEDPDTAPSGNLDDACWRIIRLGWRCGRVAAAGRRTVRIAGRVAVIAAVLVVMLSIAFATPGLAPLIRGALDKWNITTYKDHTQVQGRIDNGVDEEYLDKDGNLRIDHFTLVPGWLPKGFVLKETGLDESICWLIYHLPRQQAKNIFISMSNMSGSTTSFDTENADVSYMTIQDNEATVISKKENGVEYNTVVWFMDGLTAMVQVSNEGVSIADTIKIAENLHVVWED